MTNNFQNFIDFVAVDEALQSKNIHANTAKLRVFEASQSDFWRLLIPKSALYGHSLATIEARVVQLSTDCKGVWDGASFVDSTKRATIRKQLSEDYTEFTLKVNDFPTTENYKQFALVRSNGQQVLGTVKATAESIEEYTAKIQEAFEAYPYTKVIVRRNGTFLTVRAWNNKQFRLDDEQISVAIGTVSERNANTPSLNASFIGSVSYPAQNSYKVNIENVEEGNIFTLNGVSYTATDGDTAEDVIAALLLGESRLVVNASTTVSQSAVKGSRYVINNNTPTLTLTYVDTFGANDRYAISVGSSIKAGNTYEITGGDAKTYTATATDTQDTIKAALVTSGMYYTLPTGTAPSWSAIAGTQFVENVNTPRITLSDLVTIPATTKDKYRVIVGTSVNKGNVFRLNDTFVTADSTDNADTIGVKLGLAADVDTIEVTTGTSVLAYALLGDLYTSEDIAEIEIIGQPRILKSSQLVLEIDWAGLSGMYSVQLYDIASSQAVAYCNPVKVSASSYGTKLLEVADSYDTNGFEYYEPALTQIIRVPIHTSPPKQRTSENRVKLLGGGYRRTNTTIEDTQELITRAEDSYFHKVLNLWLKHSQVWIDGQGYFVEGDYSEVIISEYPELIQASATVVPRREHNNKVVYFATDSKPMKYGRCVVSGESYGITLTMRKNYNDSILAVGSNSLVAAEYLLIIDNDGDDKLIQVAFEGFQAFAIVAPKRSRLRLRELVRIDSGLTVNFVVKKQAALEATYSDETTYAEGDVIVYGLETETEYLTSFSDDFGDDFAI